LSSRRLIQAKRTAQLGRGQAVIVFNAPNNSTSAPPLICNKVLTLEESIDTLRCSQEGGKRWLFSTHQATQPARPR